MDRPFATDLASRWRTLGDLPVSAASGLVKRGDRFFVVADDELHLCEFGWTAGSGISNVACCVLLPGTLPSEARARKARKADFESLALLPDGALLALPSGSAPNRVTGACLTPAQLGADPPLARAIDFSAIFAELHARLTRMSGIDVDLNLEGAAVAGDRLRLLQRGNGAGGLNAVIDLDLDRVVRGLREGSLAADCLRAVTACELGSLRGVSLGFTDAAPWSDDGSLVFVASAEGGGSAYEDGACAGSVIGWLDSQGRVSGPVQEISSHLKIEGVWAERRGERHAIWAVTDADDPGVAAQLLYFET